MKRRVFLGSSAAAFAMLPAAAKAQFSPYRQPLTIGINAPLSGSAATGGNQLIVGAQAAIDYANQFMPMLASAFMLRTFDDAGELAQAVNNVQFAAADPTVIGMLGGFNGSAIVRALPTYANAQMPLLVPASTADGITEQGYQIVWRLPTKDSMEGRLFARFIAGRKKPKMAIAVCQDGLYGADVMNGFTNQARSSKFAADGYTFPSSHPDYAAAAQRILARSADYVFLCGQTAQLGPLIPALRVAGYTGDFGASEGFYNTQTAADYADAFKGGFISSSFPPLTRVADATGELNDFRSRANITIVSAFAYAATQIIMDAARRTGATNRLSTLTALQAPASYDTVVGNFSFMPNGDPVDPNLYFYTIAGGRWSYVAPSHASAFVL